MTRVGGGVEGQIASSDFLCLTRQMGVGDVGTDGRIF
jgi:hypothetical protein